ncbi:MAG TPA: phosphatase PAP2 family protein [Opitutaceae bacterium]|nr:phosphatase PAP2 family protein [Opitutaceae bacterium]
MVFPVAFVAGAFTFMSQMKPLQPASQTRDSPAKDSWLRQVWPRMRTLWVAKVTGTVVSMPVFFVVYFWLLNHRFFPVTMVPLTAVDRLVGFCPETFPLYVSLWAYVVLPPMFLKNRRELGSYGLAVVGLSVIAFGFFLFWPTGVPKSEIDWSQHPSVAFLKTVDASGNACPSLHVAFAVFTAIWLECLLREMGAGRFVRALNWLWCVGILYSTMAIRQHVAVDVLAGTALGAIVVALHLRILYGTSSRPRPRLQVQRSMLPIDPEV